MGPSTTQYSQRATSELISNNAIQLSVFITDNLGLDSNTDAMMGYAAIELLVAQRRYSEAIASLLLGNKYMTSMC